MANILDILTRAQALRQETALNSITPDRAGGIMYDTLILINQMQLEGGSLLISKVYSSVAAMEADTTPTSDLTGRALRPGQLAVIVPSSSSSSDMGSVYRYNEPGSWTLCGKIGGLPLDTAPIQGSSNGITSGAVYTALSALRNEGYKYMGIATPGSGGTAPGTPNQPVFYIAGPGSYPNFGSITVASGYLGFIKYSGGSWSVESVAVGKDYDEQISQLEHKVDGLAPILDGLKMEDWEQGSINSSGIDLSSTTRIRTTQKIYAIAPLSLHCAAGYGYRVFEYEGRNFVQYQNFDNGGLNTYTPSNSNSFPIFRFCLLKTSGADITPADARSAKFVVSREIPYRDETLSDKVLSAPVPYTKKGKYVTMSSAVVGQALTITELTSADYAYWELACTPKQKFLLNTINNGMASKSFCILDKNNIVLRVEKYSTDRVVIVPDGGVKMIVNSRVASGDAYYVNDSVGRVTTLEKRVTTLEDGVDAEAAEVKDAICIVDFTATNGSYYNSSHTISSQENWSILSPIDVSGYIGQKYRIRVYCPSGQIARCWFEEEDHTEIETIYSDADNVIEGVVPADAKWLYLSNRWASFATPTVWIDTIGTKLATEKYVQDALSGGGFKRNDLYGKKVSFIGDSITAGYYASDADHRYCNIFCAKYGATVNNLGVASTCIANNTLNGLSSQRFVTRATSANLADSKLIVVFGGTNDFSYDCKAIGNLFAEETITATDYIGNKKKVAVTDTDSFAGAMHDLISTIRTNCPKVPIVFITPLKRGRYNTGRPTSKETNQWGNYLDDFCTAIKEICAYYSIPVLDANSISELDFSDNAISTEFSQDSLHPNDNGHAVLAELLFRFVENNVVVL